MRSLVGACAAVAAYLGACALIAYALSEKGQRSHLRNAKSGGRENESKTRAITNKLGPEQKATSSIDERRNHQSEPNNFEKATGIGTVILAMVGIGALILTFCSNRETEQAFKTAQMPYVALGGRDGKIGNLLNQTIEGKPIIALRFYNGGQSMARHFTVYIGPVIPGTNKSSIRHRHRYRTSNGGIFTEGAASFGLAAQSEYIEYVIDPQRLWTFGELNNINDEFAIGGDIEYCDEFGVYHCEGWGAEYVPSLGQFVPSGPITLPCVREQGDPKRLERTLRNTQPQVTVKEIDPCEQPDEPEYYNEH